MWPVTIALGVYYVCKGIQEGMDENRERNPQLTHQPRKQLNRDPLNGSGNSVVSDCYHEIQQGWCDEGY